MHELIEIFFSLSMFINAALFIPQSVKAYREKNAKNLSLVTFGGFNLIQVSMVLHGYTHRDWSLAIGMFLSFITCGTVTVQILIETCKKIFSPAKTRQI